MAKKKNKQQNYNQARQINHIRHSLNEFPQNLAQNLSRRLALREAAQRETIPSTSKADSPPAYESYLAISDPQADLQAEMAESKKPLVQGIAKLFNNTEHADMKIFIGAFELRYLGIAILQEGTGWWWWYTLGDLKDTKGERERDTV
ncbi:uncharacterized protein F4822DRAFT_423514 [Hypoxylon trugodes]|uniref:uncharacterized protein n=1 Tax=Hypoxylon trugodes TaxID=326681 RepID=UPI00218F0DA3|nr:uncharacterized protein F4822DRAFT_423514 [Hypoxylon trugodes]KAI1382544.1 hypothetical protein F4822DRAFT_423514 [Hypoxylon trugodes]